MKAAIIQSKKTVVLAEVPKPEPRPGHVRIAVDVCGICGSDLHFYSGAWKYGDTAPGHEYVGRIDAVGEGVTGLQPGDRVTVQAIGHCGRCPECERGDYQLCRNLIWLGKTDHGGLAELAIAHASMVLKVPDTLSDRQAALLEPLAVSWHAVTRFGRAAQETVLVIGGGTIGLLSAACAKALGAGQVAIVTKYPPQDEAARALGADHVIRLGDGNPRDAAKDLFGPLGAALVVDSVAAGSSLTLAVEAAARAGRIVLVGGVTKPLLAMFGPLVNREITLKGSNCYGLLEGRHDFDWSADLLAAGTVDADLVVTHTFPLDQVADAFATAADKSSGTVKVHVRIRP
jgi:2-desacetyl-2-hydroxyethyl bacteriochlorophyllide A dehydrogenase